MYPSKYKVFIDWFVYKFLFDSCICFILSKKKVSKTLRILALFLSRILPFWFEKLNSFHICTKEASCFVPSTDVCWMRIMSLMMIYVLFRQWDTFHFPLKIIRFILFVRPFLSRSEFIFLFLHFLLHFHHSNLENATHSKADDANKKNND